MDDYKTSCYLLLFNYQPTENVSTIYTNRHKSTVNWQPPVIDVGHVFMLLGRTQGAHDLYTGPKQDANLPNVDSSCLAAD